MIRPFRISEVAKVAGFSSVLALVDGLPHTGPVMHLVVRVVGLRLLAAVELAPQALGELELALRVGKPVLLLLQFGVVVGELVEQNGDGHAIEDDAERDAAECHAAAQIGDRHDVTVAHSGDAHLEDDKDEVSACL